APAMISQDNLSVSLGTHMKGGSQSLTRDGSSQNATACRGSLPDPKSVIRLATWNVLSLNGTGYQTTLVKELAKYRIAAAGITEARLLGSGENKVAGATIIHSGGKDHARGVALILRPPLSWALMSWQAVSDRLLYARLSHRQGHL